VLCDARLAGIADAWDRLPEPVKATIVALVAATT
jgi:hypothetical protein